MKPPFLKAKPFPDRQDIAILGACAIAVTLLISLAMVQIDAYTTVKAYAQGGEITPSELLAQVDRTVVAISGLMATAIGIVSGAVAWLRARFGDKVISDGANEWFQWFFEEARTINQDLKDAVKQVAAKGAELDVVVDVAKKASPEFAKLYDENAPKAMELLQKVQKEVEEEWQPEIDRVYEVSPKADPVGK